MTPEERLRAIVAERNEHAEYFRREFLEKYKNGEDCDERLVRLAIFELRDQMDRMLYELRLLNMGIREGKYGFLFKIIFGVALIYICYKIS